MGHVIAECAIKSPEAYHLDLGDKLLSHGSYFHCGYVGRHSGSSRNAWTCLGKSHYFFEQGGGGGEGGSLGNFQKTAEKILQGEPQETC